MRQITEHARFFYNESGLKDIRPSLIEAFAEMSDREVADRAFSNGGDEEYRAELVARNLSGLNVTQDETYIRIALRERIENRNTQPQHKMAMALS